MSDTDIDETPLGLQAGRQRSTADTWPRHRHKARERRRRNSKWYRRASAKRRKRLEKNNPSKLYSAHQDQS
ncbi:hypothetical protein, partial [Mycobacterium avium]|uniref:hypothetical protein n=1 Tax=Mycobacterium avium TaxID=1764 RepID=UPI001E65428B